MESFLKSQSGFWGTKVYNLIITQDGIIVAQINIEMMCEHVSRIQQVMQDEGRLKRALATMNSGFSLHQRYVDIHQADIPTETPGNFNMPAREIASIKVKQGPHYPERRHPDKVAIK